MDGIVQRRTANAESCKPNKQSSSRGDDSCARMIAFSPRKLLRWTLQAMIALSVGIPGVISQGQMQSVHLGPNGRLQYTKSVKGDRIPDFSSAGYHGGGVALPHVRTRMKVFPSGGPDDTAIIQAALDKVANLAPGPHGHRGAVELAAGTFFLRGTLVLKASGVVIRGAGADGQKGSILRMIGTPHRAIEIKGKYQEREIGAATHLTDMYVAAGANVVHIADTTEIQPGDLLRIVRPVSSSWIHFMGMDRLMRRGEQETWLKHDIPVFRRVASVEGATVRLQVPLTDSFDTRFYPTARLHVARVHVSGRIREVGIEDLRVVAPDRSISYRQDAEFDGVVMDDVLDAWMRSVAFEDTTNSVRVEHSVARLTILGVEVHQHSTVTSRAKPADFSVNGSQILLDRCSGTGDKVSYVETQGESEGPVVILHCRFLGGGMIEGHQRWSTGLLIDGCEMPGGNINMRNRGVMGSGHGWSIGWSVSWNNTAAAFLVQSPPGAVNWSIGDVGEHSAAPMPMAGQPEGALLPSGVIEAENKHVEPASLYLQQLKERRGPAAVTAIGYK